MSLNSLENNMIETKIDDIKEEKIEVPTISSIKSTKKTKNCRVINYVESHGILGFDFDGVGCQIMIKPYTKIGNYIDIKYTGEIGKDIKFFL